jgi:hypothetical protein
MTLRQDAAALSSTSIRRLLLQLGVCSAVAASLGGGCDSSGNGPMDPGGEPNDPVVVQPTATVEIGYTDQKTGAYATIGDGAVMPLFTMFQGGSHIFVTFRATGFPTAGDGTTPITLRQRIVETDTGEVLAAEITQNVRLQPLGDGRAELPSRFIFLDGLPDVLDGEMISLSFTLTSALNASYQVEVAQTMVVRQ